MLHELTLISSLHRVKLNFFQSWTWFFSIFLTYLFLSAPSFAASRGLGFEQLHRRGQPQLPLLQQAEHSEAAAGEEPSRWKPSEQSSVPRAFMSSTEQLHNSSLSTGCFIRWLRSKDATLSGIHRHQNVRLWTRLLPLRPGRREAPSGELWCHRVGVSYTSGRRDGAQSGLSVFDITISDRTHTGVLVSDEMWVMFLNMFF